MNSIAGDAAPDRATVTEAARRLDLNPSTVSRQVEKFGLAKDEAGRFDFVEYERRRETDLNPLMRRVPSARPVDDDDDDLPLAGAAAEHKALQARLLQIRIAEKEGDLVLRAGVDELVTTASRSLRDALLAIPSRLAGELAAMTDAAAIAAVLDAAIRRELETLANSFRSLAVPDKADAA